MSKKLGHPGDGFGAGQHPMPLLAGEHKVKVAGHPARNEGCDLLLVRRHIIAAIANFPA